MLDTVAISKKDRKNNEQLQNPTQVVIYLFYIIYIIYIYIRRNIRKLNLIQTIDTRLATKWFLRSSDPFPIWRIFIFRLSSAQ